MGNEAMPLNLVYLAQKFEKNVVRSTRSIISASSVTCVERNMNACTGRKSPYNEERFGAHVCRVLIQTLFSVDSKFRPITYHQGSDGKERCSCTKS
jgi:hypothetical protein